MRLLNKGLLLVVLAGGAAAHVGNTDVYLEGTAGPYRLLSPSGGPPSFRG